MNATTKTCCLLGNPVGHSKSPFIHNTLAKMMGINMVYTAYKVEDGRLGDAIKGADALDFLGLNITVPYKCDVMEYLAEIDTLAEKIGAVNTLVRTDKGYKGYNTDIIGLGRQLEEENIIIKDKEVILIGAGGAAKAIAYLCGDMGAKGVYILNRNREKAEALAAEINSYFGKIAVPLGLEDYRNIPEGKYPVIQTTSVGLYPDIEKAAIMEDDFYKYVESGVDIIFNPEETLFMRKCAQAGARSFNGLKMLLYQGIAGFELWNNVKVPEDMVREVYELLQKEMKA